MKVDKEKIITWRRYFHQHPELSGEEQQTALFIAQLLRSWGLAVSEHVGGGYGVVGMLAGDPEYKCIALRADMDALPVLEDATHTCRSLIEGKMHACGHDAHMAMVLGAAEALAKDPPAGTVKFIFQPHEERKPGGAGEMVAAGVLDNPHVDGIIATHVTNSFPFGSIGISTGAVMAASDDFDLIVTGKSGHGAIPHETVDPVAIAAQIITAYHEIVSRKINPILPAVLSVCSVNTIQTHNVIPESIVLKGTVRCFDLQVRDQIRTEMQRVAAGICAAWGASFELDYVEGYPPVINEREMTALVQRAVKSIGAAQAVAVERPPMGGEDFAIFANQRPGAFFFTGTGSARCQAPWHDYAFAIEEDALPLGSQVFEIAARTFANQKK